MNTVLRTRIQAAIRSAGCFQYLVTASSAPRFAYTVGLVESLGYELVLAGASVYSKDEVFAVLKAVARRLMVGENLELESGSFSERPVSASWCGSLLLGATDYFGYPVEAKQLVPDELHLTLDTPDLSRPKSARINRAWRFLESWPYSVPRKSVVGTTLSVIRGAPIVEVTRWEEDYWEMLPAADSVKDKTSMRALSYGMMLGLDKTLTVSTTLQIGEALSRSGPGAKWKQGTRE